MTQPLETMWIKAGDWLRRRKTQRALSVITRLGGQGRGHTDKEHNHASISLIEPLGGEGRGGAGRYI